MQAKDKKLISWILIVVSLLICSLITLPGEIGELWKHHDKDFHLLVFALFMVVTRLFFKNLSILKISLITFSLGLLIEILQGVITIAHRQFDLYDILFNVIGIGLGVVILLIYPGGEK